MSQPTPEEMKQLDAAVKVATKAGVEAAEATSKRVLADELAKVNFAYRVRGNAEADVAISAAVAERIDGKDVQGVVGLAPNPQRGKQEAFTLLSLDYNALNAALAKGARVACIEGSLCIVEHPPGPTSEERGELMMAYSRSAGLSGALQVLRDRLSEGEITMDLYRIIDDALGPDYVEGVAK